jgi:hypothetical protein
MKAVRWILLLAMVAAAFVLLLRPPASDPGPERPAVMSSIRSRAGQPTAAPATPAPAFASIAADKDPVRGSALYAARLLELSPADFAREFQDLLRLPISAQRDLYLKMLLRQWGRSDPSQAMTFLDNLPGLSVIDNGTYTQSVLQGWAWAKPEEAWSFAVDSYNARPSQGITEQGRYGPFGQGRIRAVFSALIESGDLGTLTSLVTSAPDEIGGFVSSQLASALTAVDRGATESWVMGLPETGLKRANAMVGFTRELATEDPAALEAFFGKLTSPRDRTGAAGSIIESFRLKQDRSGAFQWMAQNAGNLDLIVPMMSAVNIPPDKPGDESVARSLLASIPESNRRIVLTTYIRQIRNDAPIDAMTAAIQLSAAADRERTTLDVAQNWAQRDPSAATNFIATSRLIPDDLRSKLAAGIVPK